MDVSGAQVRRIRQALHFTQEFLALLLGVRAKEVQRWEQGKRRMGWRAQMALVKLLQEPEARAALERAGVRLEDDG